MEVNILIVENNPTVAKLFTEGLQAHLGKNIIITIVPTLEDGRTKLSPSGERYDATIFSGKVTDGDTFDLIEHLRTNSNSKEAIIFYTAKERWRVEAVRNMKPYSPNICVLRTREDCTHGVQRLKNLLSVKWD